VIISYRKLIWQHHMLEKLSTEAKTENTDKLRREHNAIVRNYNHTLDGFIGKRLAKKLKYTKKEIIEKI